MTVLDLSPSQHHPAVAREGAARPATNKSFLHALRIGEGEVAPAALLWADADQAVGWVLVAPAADRVCLHICSCSATYDGFQT